jgi:hypothetical protein
MDPISIPATPRTPDVQFDPAGGLLRLSGESYPEDAAAFFGPLHRAVDEWFAAGGETPFTAELALTYFNSSSAKALMNLFMLLEDHAAAGRSVTVRWLYDEDDDTISEAGEDFAADFQSATFELVAKVNP